MAARSGRGKLAAIGPSITIIVPTFCEAESLPHLLDRIGRLRASQALDLDVRIMDDDSQDGTEQLIASRAEPWVELVVRHSDPGLSQAVVEGLQGARGDVLIGMDADLSHPPETIPSMLQALSEGFDFVVGSRYIEGGSTAHDWGVVRWLNSRVATVLARPFTSIQDPMSGFFAVHRSTLENAAELNPVGYKIALELIVKCACVRVGEVPIHFEDRRYGESKLSLAQQLLYLRHLRRLAIFKYGVWSHLAQFLVVGLLGTGVNLVLLTWFLSLGIANSGAVAAAILLSIGFNFALNRRFSFSYARSGSLIGQFAGYLLASAAGAILNYAVTLSLLARQPDMLPQVAALFGIAAGTIVNFISSRYLVFRRKHIRPDEPEP